MTVEEREKKNANFTGISVRINTEDVRAINLIYSYVKGKHKNEKTRMKRFLFERAIQNALDNLEDFKEFFEKTIDKEDFNKQ